MSTNHPVRLTPPQLTVLQRLREGWECRTGGACPPRFHKLLTYAFHRGEDTRWTSGTTLGSLAHRGLIAWEATTLRLVIDGSEVPGQRLVLTPAGVAVVGTSPRASAKAKETYG